MKFAIAPEIQRQRLLVEGYFTIEVNRNRVAEYFKTITSGLNLRAYGEPIIFSPGGEGKDINQGYDAFIPLIDSGIALYVWTNAKFFSAVIYTCKSFSSDEAIQITKKFFGAEKIVNQEF
jgi:S-adenosylmethionine decarboxylase